jgi:hypothetical protein
MFLAVTRQGVAVNGSLLPLPKLNQCRTSPIYATLSQNRALARNLLMLCIIARAMGIDWSDDMSLISGLGALAYPLTAALGAVKSSNAQQGIGNTFQNLLASQAGASPTSLTSSSLTQAPAAAKKTGADEFKDYMAMSPAEKMRYSIMNDLGITQEKLDAMSPEQRATIEKKIADLMKLRQEIQEAANNNGGQVNQAALNISLLKQVRAGQRPEASEDIFS